LITTRDAGMRGFMSTSRVRFLLLGLLVAVSIGLPVVGRTQTPPPADVDTASDISTTADTTAVTIAPAVTPSPSPSPSPSPARVTAASAVYRPHTVTVADRLRSGLGLLTLLGLCVLFSRNRRRIDWRLVGVGMLLQATLALLLLGSGLGRGAFAAANDAIVSLLGYAKEGTRFLFASYVSGHIEGAMVNFAFDVLPSIVFFSALMAVLYHLGVMQVVIRGLSWLMQRTLRTSGAETLSTAANIFVGQTEAPLLVRPFVGEMTKSELMAVMAGGMANTAGGVLAAYVGMLYTFFPDIAGHLLVQSILSAPAALVTSKILWPEDGDPVTRGSGRIEIPRVDANTVEAAARGAGEGLQLAFNVAAMLIAFIALVAMLDGGLGALTRLVGLGTITFQTVAGWLFWPFAWLMGTPVADCTFVGQLLGQKIVLNEFVAYGTLSTALQAGGAPLSQHAMLIASYALSGFANFGSIAILIGGLGALAPERRGDVAALGMPALVAGSFATFMTACFAAMLA